jgi:hypothetical protein
MLETGIVHVAVFLSVSNGRTMWTGIRNRADETTAAARLDVEAAPFRNDRNDAADA